MSILKNIAAHLPNKWQAELKRIHFRRQIAKRIFVTDEPEYNLLPQIIRAGDWAIDVGANVGHYTNKLSELVGSNGRIIAIEPVPATFSLLSSNSEFFAFQNVTLINAAISNKMDILGMSIPTLSTGLANYYEAHLSLEHNSQLSVLTLPLDSFSFVHPIALIKIDVEGHEAMVLEGMKELIQSQHPVLIVETRSEDVISALHALGYSSERLQNSPNVIFRPI